MPEETSVELSPNISRKSVLERATELKPTSLQIKGINNILGFECPELLPATQYPKKIGFKGKFSEIAVKALRIAKRKEKEVLFRTKVGNTGRVFHAGIQLGEAEKVVVTPSSKDLVIWHTHQSKRRRISRGPTFGRKDVAGFLTDPRILGMGVVDSDDFVHLALKGEGTPFRIYLLRSRQKRKIIARLRQESQELGGENFIECHVASILNLFERKDVAYYLGKLTKAEKPTELQKLESLDDFRPL